MLKLQENLTPTYEVPQCADERSGAVLCEPAAARTQRPRRPAETFGLRELRNLSVFGALWAGYLWVHVAGAIELFGRP
jgi:hypothetical protein